MVCKHCKAFKDGKCLLKKMIFRLKNGENGCKTKNHTIDKYVEGVVKNGT